MITQLTVQSMRWVQELGPARQDWGRLFPVRKRHVGVPLLEHLKLD